MTQLSSNGIPPHYPQCRKRTIHIYITYVNDKRVEVTLWGDQFPDPDRDFGFRGQPNLNYEELKAAIDLLLARQVA